MSRKLALFIGLAVIGAGAVLAQQPRSFTLQEGEGNPVHKSEARAFQGLTATGVRRFESSTDAEQVIRMIVQHVPMRYPVQAFVSDDPAQVPNAEARIVNQQRIVSFNREFMRQIQQSAGNHWALVGIAAHEVGHHAGNHTFMPSNDCKLNAEIELEADYYAGFALGKMKTKFDDSISGMRALPFALGTCSHPPRERRVQEVGRGWRDATGGQVATAPAPPVPPAVQRMPAGFTQHRNRDIFGGDIETLPGLALPECAQRCSANGACRAFAFDRWKGWCFLKSTTADSVLEPSSLLGIKSAFTLTSVAHKDFTIIALKRKRFKDAPLASGTLGSEAECRAACEPDQRCVAYSYGAATRQCDRFAESEGYFYEEGWDSGFKRQRPLPAISTLPGGGAPSSRMERRDGQYFKGDGYEKHDGASAADCDALCLKDTRCVATEHIPKDRTCRLYAVQEPSLATTGTSVAFKRSSSLAPTPGPAATAGFRMEPRGGHYFKGDGYQKHDGKAAADCDDLCLRDNRCIAVEHAPAQRTCRLYSAAEPALPAAGTNVGFKRPR